MEFTLLRMTSSSEDTRGIIFSGVEAPLYVVEPPDTEVIGVHYQFWNNAPRSAVPAGRYRMVIGDTRAKGLVIQDVPGFPGACITSESRDRTSGVRDRASRCSAVVYFTPEGEDSARALNELITMIRKGLRQPGEEVWLTVTRQYVQQVAS